jgi:Icc-related predicted phosphoesterase
MRCLLVSDLHYALKQYDWVDAVAGEFDLVVVAGDHLDISATLPVQAQVVAIVKQLRRIGERTRLLVSSGNHDLTARDKSGEKVAPWIAQIRRQGIPTDGDSLTIGDTLITICPWWDGPQNREAVAQQLACAAEQRAQHWIWVYHAPPKGSPISFDGNRHYGDAELTTWVEQYRPDMVFCGHIHQSPFRNGGSWVDRIGSTWLFNAGRQIGPVPCHIIIDTAQNEARWQSLAGLEKADLTGTEPTRIELD